MACRLSLKSEALTRKSWDSYLSCKQETRLKTALCWPPTLLKIKRIGWSWNAMPFNLNPFQNENAQCVYDHTFRTFLYQCSESRGSRFQIKADSFPNIPSQTMYGNFEYRSLICWGLLPELARRIKRYPAHFIVEENLFEDLFRIIVHLLLVHLHKKLISR